MNYKYLLSFIFITIITCATQVTARSKYKSHFDFGESGKSWITGQQITFTIEAPVKAIDEITTAAQIKLDLNAVSFTKRSNSIEIDDYEIVRDSKNPLLMHITIVVPKVSQDGKYSMAIRNENTGEVLVENNDSFRKHMKMGQLIQIKLADKVYTNKMTIEPLDLPDESQLDKKKHDNFSDSENGEDDDTGVGETIKAYYNSNTGSVSGGDVSVQDEDKDMYLSDDNTSEDEPDGFDEQKEVNSNSESTDEILSPETTTSSFEPSTKSSSTTFT